MATSSTITVEDDNITTIPRKGKIMEKTYTQLNEQQRTDFLRPDHDNYYIPGYTGHCPGLKFHYGKCYGSRTKEILKDMKSQRFFHDATDGERTTYQEADYEEPVLKSVEYTKGQLEDFVEGYDEHKAPRYIYGYTGFVPTLNLRYGKSYGHDATDDSIREYTKHEKSDELKREQFRHLHSVVEEF